MGVLNFDAQGDNAASTPEERAAQQNWPPTWALRIFDLPNVPPAHFTHVGLRGPRNDPGVMQRFLDVGVPRDNLYTYADLKRGRRSDLEAFCCQAAARALDGAARLWVAVDQNVLNMGVSLDHGDDPLGLTVEELCEIVYQAGLQGGRQRFAGLSIMAVPPGATTLHWIMAYTLLHGLAGVVHSATA